MKHLIFSCSLLMLLAPLATADMTYAERLGWPKDARVLMIHADDAGLSHASNQAIIETVEAGAVTSFSIMTPCSWTPEIVDYLKAHPNVCAGVHLTFTSEWTPYRWAPVAGRDAVPGLVDAQGWMHADVPAVKDNATAEEIEIEMRAQIALAEKMGVEVSHIDSHMGTLYAKPSYLKVYMKVGIEKQLPIMVVGGHGTQFSKSAPGILPIVQGLARKAWNAGLPVLDDINTQSYDWKTADKKDHFIDLIRNLKPGITWANVHPTTPTPEGKAFSGNRELLFGDYHGLIDPEVMETIRQEGVILTDFRELMRRRAAVK